MEPSSGECCTKAINAPTLVQVVEVPRGSYVAKIKCFSTEGAPESNLKAEGSDPHTQGLSVEGCATPASISGQSPASEISSPPQNVISACSSPKMVTLSIANKNALLLQAQANLSVLLAKTNLTKEQRDAFKAQKEREKAQKERDKAELKAKKDAENLKKEKEKADLKAKKEAENLRRDQEKKEKQQKKEQEIRERREKKEQEEVERKERKEKREAERKKKDDEKKQKEEEKKKKLEEKEQLKEEKLRRENQAKMKFRSFFTIEKPPIKRELATAEAVLTPFSIKDGMTLAGPSRLPLQDMSDFDHLLEHQDSTVDYLQTCRSSFRKKDRTARSEPVIEAMDVDADSCQSWGSIQKEKIPKFKLLQFHQNHRPSYYGSWTKPRGCINPRNPYKMDSGLLDYSMDSDEEWVEEEPGESIANSDDEEKEMMEGEDEDDDDGFFVPHGYLSNDEGDQSDIEGDLGLDPNVDPKDPQDRKNSQLAKAKVWEAEFARKCQLLSTKKIGPLWLHPQMTNALPDRSVSCDEAFLMKFAAVSLVPLPIPYPMASVGESSVESSDHNLHQAMPDLIRFIHKSSMGMTKIIRLFRAHWGATIQGKSQETPPLDSSVLANDATPNKVNHTHQTIDSTPKRSKTPTRFQGYEATSGISKRQLEMKIQAIAMKEIRLPINKPVWYVHTEILKQYGLDQENIVALVSDSSSPILVRADLLSTTNTTISPDTIAKQRKRKGYEKTSKSLMHFLKTSQSSPSPKRVKTEDTPLEKQQEHQTKESDEVIFVKMTSIVVDENSLKEPPAKKLHLEASKPEPLATAGQVINIDSVALSGQADNVSMLA